MKQVSSIANNFLDSILPEFNSPRTSNAPIWNESQQMFIIDQYTSNSGNTYYLGVRLAKQYAIILHIGLYHNWMYINEVEIYAFNGVERILIGKTKLDQFYNEDLVRTTTEKLLRDYIESQLRIQGMKMDNNQLEETLKQLVDSSYCSMLENDNLLKRLEATKSLMLTDHRALP